MKRIALFVVLCLSGSSIFGQKVIENPPFLAASSPSLSITRVELCDTCTILDCRVKQPAGRTVSVAAESYIQPSAGGERLYVKSAEGVELVRQITMPKEGVINYRLYFPKLDSAFTKIDFGKEGTPAGSPWFIYDIELAPTISPK